jgi:hypothetical protein
MRVLSSKIGFGARGALAGGIFAAISMLAIAPGYSASAEPPAAVAGKLLGKGLSKLWADPSARVPVIVQFAKPDVAAAATFDSPADADAAQTRAVHAAQDAILGTAFGSSVLSGTAADDLKVKRMDFSPMFGITVTAAELEKLAANPSVVRIQEDELSKPLLDEAVPLVGMTNAYAQGATGNGWAVAVLDSGTRRTHEFVAGKVVSAACYSTTTSSSTPGSSFNSQSYCPGGVPSSVAIDSANDCPTSIEGCGHGTHVSGIAAGFNTNRQAGEPSNGVARSGGLITINVFSQFTSLDFCGTTANDCILSFNSDQILGLERVFALRNTFKIAAINMSLGGGQNFSACDGDGRKPIIDQLKAAGIATLIAAGNNGFDSSVSTPGCISSAITVGSSTKGDVRSSFSNWGTLIDIVAPGSSIFSSVVDSDTSYGFKSGTSMATPMAAGAFAAIRSARPNATVDQIENALKTTGLGITAAGVTKPRIRVDQALAVTPGGNPAAIVSAVTPVARATVVNGTVTAFATILNTGGATATSCSIALPAGATSINFTYSARNVTTGAPENPNVPVNIAANSGRNFVISFRPTAVLSSSLSLVFDCTNTTPAPSVAGLNTFLLTATSTAPADLVSVAVTPTNDGIMNVPLGSTGFASLAAVNIGATASLQARLSANPIGVTGRSLAAAFSMCQTNPTTGACITGQAATINFTAGANATVTFSAFVFSNGTAIPFDPANKRLFVHFFQGNNPVGSASVAVRTTAAPSPAVAAAATTTASAE